MGLLSKTTTLHVHHAFCTLFAVVAGLGRELPNFTFYEGREQEKR